MGDFWLTLKMLWPHSCLLWAGMSDKLLIDATDEQLKSFWGAVNPMVM